MLESETDREHHHLRNLNLSVSNMESNVKDGIDFIILDQINANCPIDFIFSVSLPVYVA